MEDGRAGLRLLLCLHVCIIRMLFLEYSPHTYLYHLTFFLRLLWPHGS